MSSQSVTKELQTEIQAHGRMVVNLVRIGCVPVRIRKAHRLSKTPTIIWSDPPSSRLIDQIQEKCSASPIQRHCLSL